jgi:hypothetical protein
LACSFRHGERGPQFLNIQIPSNFLPGKNSGLFTETLRFPEKRT